MWMAAAPMTVVEMPFFLRKAATILDEEERSELVNYLGRNPEAGVVVPESGGVRKCGGPPKAEAKAAALG
jgi:hypothetical protein